MQPKPIIGTSHHHTGEKETLVSLSFPFFSRFPFSFFGHLYTLRLSSMSLVEQAKKKAAHAAVDDYIAKHLQNVDEEAPLVVGIGSGSTIVYAVERLIEIVGEAKKAHGGKARQVVCIPTSFQATQLIQDAPHGLLHLGDLARHSVIDVAIDGADEVDANLQLIKGGGGCCTQEKIVAVNAKQFVVVADYRKQSKLLGEKWRKGVPVEVIPISYKPLMRKFETLGGRPVLRMGEPAKAGPCVTDNGNFLIDVDFGTIADPEGLHKEIKLLAGVVETGLFINMAEKAYFGLEDGTVSAITKP